MIVLSLDDTQTAWAKLFSVGSSRDLLGNYIQCYPKANENRIELKILQSFSQEIIRPFQLVESLSIAIQE